MPMVHAALTVKLISTPFYCRVDTLLQSSDLALQVIFSCEYRRVDLQFAGQLWNFLTETKPSGIFIVTN